MDVKNTRNCNSKDAREEEEGSSNSNSNSNSNEGELKRGPWTVEEDLKLINYVAIHGEGRWNSLSRAAGLKRTGKSCRLRWLNYLRPDVRRGNITLEEQLIILELHSRWGNRWSKIAQYLPGRTDNEIKNYWRTRVQKHAKQLKCDVNSKQFKDTMKYLWMPRLIERIQATGVSPNDTTTSLLAPTMSHCVNVNFTAENSCAAAASSSESLETSQVSPTSDLNEEMMVCNVSAASHGQLCYRPLDHPQSSWFDGGDSTSDGLWNVDDVNWFM